MQAPKGEKVVCPRTESTAREFPWHQVDALNGPLHAHTHTHTHTHSMREIIYTYIYIYTHAGIYVRTQTPATAEHQVRGLSAEFSLKKP